MMRFLPGLSSQYRLPFFFALMLHLSLIAFLLVQALTPSATVTKERFAQHKKPIRIVKAVAIDQGKVAAEIQKIQSARRNAAAKLRDQQRRAKRVTRAAKKTRLAELAKLAKLKKQWKATQTQHAKKLQSQLQALKKLKQQQTKVKKQLAQLKKQQAEQKKALEQKKKRQKKQKALEQKLLQEQLSKEEALLAKAQSREVQIIVNKYSELIKQAISHQWLIPEKFARGISCIFLIRLAPGGTVLSVKLAKTSGDPALDRSARAAIFKASPLPVPKDTTLFTNFRQLRLTVRPQGIVKT